MLPNAIQSFFTRHGVSTRPCNASELGVLGSFCENETIRVYLAECLPSRDLIVDFLWLNKLESVLEINETGSPWRDLMRKGFLIFATTMSGNGIVVDKITGKVHFANNGRFLEDIVLRYDEGASCFVTIEDYSYEAMLQGLIFVSNDLETFFGRLEHDDFRRYINELDDGIVKY